MQMTIMDGYVHQKVLKVHPKKILDDYKWYSTFFIFIFCKKAALTAAKL